MPASKEQMEGFCKAMRESETMAWDYVLEEAAKACLETASNMPATVSQNAQVAADALDQMADVIRAMKTTPG